MAQADAQSTKKADKKKELDELNELFKPVVAAQKVSKGNQHTVCERHERLSAYYVKIMTDVF